MRSDLVRAIREIAAGVSQNVPSSEASFPAPGTRAEAQDAWDAFKEEATSAEWLHAFSGKWRGQERYGMRIVGQFRDLDAPDRFADPRALHVVEHHEEARTLGAGLLPRRRQDLGKELDH